MFVRAPRYPSRVRYLLWVRKTLATVPGLNWRAWHRAMRAEHAAVAFLWLHARTAAPALIEELAGILGHRLG
jgi:hypothetical protein